VVRRKKEEDPSSIYIELASRSKRARLMEEVETFKTVPTILRGFNRATRVGGAPLSCIWLVHGPSGGGKTVFTCALIRSFQNIGGICAFVDAELSASTSTWFRQLGVDTRRCLYIGRTDPNSNEKKIPLTFEEIVEEVDGVLDGYQEKKREGKIRPGTPLLVVVDSLSKMVPKSTLKKLEKEGGDAVHSGVGRLQAAMNTSWLIALGPRIGDDDIIFAAIAHEYEGAVNGGWTPEVKVRGGNALVYDSMVQSRVTFAGQVKDHSEEGAPVVGRRHRVKILKNKHGPAFGEAYFYTATGDGISPIGFDRPRELVHEAMHRGLIDAPKEIRLTVGSSFEWQGEKYRMKDLYTEDGAEILSRLESELDAGAME
jgi:RecA/RadA recombinase